tara:strand:+ start:385 stop:492 length:108 start_codon:yes stop_codon:yes gene_type:complete
MKKVIKEAAMFLLAMVVLTAFALLMVHYNYTCYNG